MGNRLDDAMAEVRRIVSELAGAGPAHQRRLDGIDIRIAVSGIRGKSTATRWLYEVFQDRGYETFAKVTGNRAQILHDGDRRPLQRPEQVRLYENERELRMAGSPDVAILENQGIRGYTSRLVNQRYVDPHVVVLTNVREDHLDTLGESRADIARSLARSVPAGAHVVNAEPDGTLRRYLERELDRRDASVTHVRIPTDAPDLPGVELVYAVETVLHVLGESGLSDDRIDTWLDGLAIEWREVPGGRIYNAADVNDVQSTELVRRALLDEPNETPIRPVLFTRADRRGRSASFRAYLSMLADRGLLDRVHVLGAHVGLFERIDAFPVRTHDTGATTPDAVLDAALGDGVPVILMGNTVNPFMRETAAAVEERDRDAGGTDQ
jgi:hypothetical protein